MNSVGELRGEEVEEDLLGSSSGVISTRPAQAQAQALALAEAHGAQVSLTLTCLIVRYIHTRPATPWPSHCDLLRSVHVVIKFVLKKNYQLNIYPPPRPVLPCPGGSVCVCGGFPWKTLDCDCDSRLISNPCAPSSIPLTTTAPPGKPTLSGSNPLLRF